MWSVYRKCEVGAFLDGCECEKCPSESSGSDSRRNIGRTTNGSERAGGLVVRPKRAPLTPSKDDWDDRPGHASCQSWCELCVRVMQGCSIMDEKNAFATKLRSSEVVLVNFGSGREEGTRREMCLVGS